MLLFLFFIIDLYFLIPAVIVQTFVPTPRGTQTNEANAEIETQPEINEDRISKCLNTHMSSYTFHSLNHYVLFHFIDSS